MKNINPDLQAHLDEGTTMLAWCWRITRADGVTFGFTDHDRTLSFDGTDFEPESGLTASEVRSGSDLSVDAQDAEGVLTSDRISVACFDFGSGGRVRRKSKKILQKQRLALCETVLGPALCSSKQHSQGDSAVA